MLDIGLGQSTSKRGEDCVRVVLASRASTASTNQGFKVE